MTSVPSQPSKRDSLQKQLDDAEKELRRRLEDACEAEAKGVSTESTAEIRELDAWIRRNTVEKFGPVRHVKPEKVFELGFEGIQKSPRHKSGIAVRFPRILRWRTDKPAAEADTITTLRALLSE